MTNDKGTAGRGWRVSTQSSHVRQPQVGKTHYPKKNRKYLELKKKTDSLRIILWVLVLVLVLGFVIANWMIHSLQEENLRLDSEVHVGKDRAIQLQKELSQLQSANAQLVQGRIPNLQPFVFGKVIPGKTRLIESILFTVSRIGDKQHYEYMAVLRNDSDVPELPRIEILLFDDMGIQIGSVGVTDPDSSDSKGRTVLQAGEIRSFSSRLIVNKKAKPAYFRVDMSAPLLGGEMSLGFDQ